MIDEMLQSAAAANPEGAALVQGSRLMSYRELVTGAAAVTAQLWAHGVRPGDRVLVALPNRPEFATGYFATARAGAEVQVIDPAEPETELHRGTAPAAVLTNRAYLAQLSRLWSAPTIAVEECCAAENDTVATPVDPTQSWVIASSSGTTGEPQLIGRSQANQVAEADNIAATAGLTDTDALLCPVPLFHALGQFCCLLAGVRAGATVVLLDNSPETPVGEQIAETLQRHRPTVLIGVPQLFESLLELPAGREIDWSTVRLCLSGSNFLPPELPERFRARFGVALRQTYGSTETGSVTWDLATLPDPDSVGTPLRGVSVRILDSSGVEVPSGTVGEIAVCGTAVIGGPDHWHHTGDLGRMDRSGRLFVLGRKRILVDTGGRKVNPVEVERALTEHPTVAEAAAVGAPLSGGDEALVAAVVPNAETANEDVLLAHCRARLVTHKIPQRIRVLEKLPRTAVGKVRRARLAALLTTDTGDAPLRARLQGLPPRERSAELTNYLTVQLGELLNVPPAELDQDAPLHATGVDSLGALRLRMTVQRDLRLSPPMAELLGGERLTAVAERLAAQLVEPVADAPECNGGPETGEFPLSANQLALWHAEQIDPDNAAHLLVFAARITSPFDPEVLRRAFQFLVDRHPVLRTTFHERDGAPVQRVDEHAEVDFAVVHGAGTMRERFDLSAAPPLRVRLHTGTERGPVLVIAQHHLISDYWSLLIMLRELASAITAESTGDEPYLPAPARTYTDYVRWLAQAVDSPAGQADIAHWRHRLHPAPPPAELPIDRPRPPTRTHRGAALRRPVSPTTVDRLRACARAEGTTLFAVMLAAFHILLHAHTGNADSVTAVSAANRPRHDFADVLGYFTNPLPHRVQLDPDESLAHLAGRVGRELLTDLDHPLVSLEQLVDELDMPKDRSRAPLVEVGFGQNKAQDDELAALSSLVSADADGHQVRLGPLSLESVAVPDRGVPFELVCMVHEFAGSVAVVWEYNSDLFDLCTAQRISERYNRILEAASAPARPIREIALDNQGTRERLLAAGRRVSAKPPSMPDAIRSRARREPAAPAVQGEESTLTCGELDAWADRVATAVQAIGPTGRVAVRVSSAAELAVAGLGVLRAGEVCDPLDTDADIDGACLLVTTKDLAVSSTMPVVCVDGGLPAPTDLPTPPPEAPALVLRTSGVFNQPRAFVTDHRTVDAAVQRHPGGGEVPVSAERGSDRRLITMLSTVAADGTAVPTPHEGFVDVLCSGKEFSSAAATPRELAEALDRPGTPQVGTLIVSGEALPADLARRWRERTGGRVLHEYGGAEPGLAVSVQEVCDEDVTSGIVPVGTAAPGARRYVLDALGRPCPPGVVGEVCVPPPHPLHSGRADDDAPDPEHPGARLHRTGDLGRCLPDGRLVVVGRRELIEPGQHYREDPVRVESSLRAHPSVTDAVAASRAVMVQGTATAEELRNALRERLPAHLIPDDIVVCEPIPAAHNGKPARRAPQDAPAPREREAPHTPVQAALVEIWAEVLECAEVGLDDDFYALGGDSVLSLRVAAKAAERGIQLTRRQVFTHPTVRSMATVARVGTQQHALTSGLARRRAIPLTPVQRWFFDRSLDKVDHWNQTVALRTARPLNAGKLREALQAVAEHHDALRLRYRHNADGWVQVTDPTGEPLGLLERTGDLTPAVRDTHAAVDITAGPLLHAVLLRGDSGVEELALVAHHLIVDFVSWEVLLSDLELAHRQLESGESIRLPPVPTPFSEWARRLVEHADSPALQEELPFWLDQHDQLPHRPSGLEREATPADSRVPAAIVEALKTRPEPLQTQILAAVAHGITHETGLDRVCLDVEGHGREEIADDIDLSRTIGWCTAKYPLAVPVVGNSPETTLTATQHVLDQTPGSGLGHGLLRHYGSDASRERLATIPPPQASFNYLGRLGRVFGDSRTSRLFQPIAAPWGHDRPPDAARTHRWEFSAYLSDDYLHLRLVHAGEPDRAERLVRQVCAALHRLADRTKERGEYSCSEP